MLDIKFIRDNADKVRERLALRGKSYDEEVAAALALDDRRKEIILEVEGLKAEQNKVSKQIPKMKKAGEDTTAIMAEMKQIAERVKGLDAERSETEGKLREALLCIPNVPDDRVPTGTDDSCNPEVRRWGEPRGFDFEAQAHWDIGAKLYRSPAALYGEYSFHDWHRPAAQVCGGYVSSGKYRFVYDSDRRSAGDQHVPGRYHPGGAAADSLLRLFGMLPWGRWLGGA